MNDAESRIRKLEARMPKGLIPAVVYVDEGDNEDAAIETYCKEHRCARDERYWLICVWVKWPKES